jgi:stage V sporulation protein B
MSKTSFVKQAAILATASLMVRFIGFLYRVPLTNLIGDVGNAVYGRAYTIYTFLLIISSAGLPAAISKMVSERIARNEPFNAYRVFRVSLTVSAIAGLVAALILGFGARQIAAYFDTAGGHSSMYAIRSLAPTVFVVAIMSVFRGYFQGLKNNMPTAVSQVAEQLDRKSVV